MKRYYTVEKETMYIGDINQECTGLKTLTVYEINNNTPTAIKTITDVPNSENSVERIREEIEGDYELILL